MWEVIRRILVFYFARLSAVNVIYGSIATTVIVLIGFEVAAITAVAPNAGVGQPDSLCLIGPWKRRGAGSDGSGAVIFDSPLNAGSRLARS